MSVGSAVEVAVTFVWLGMVAAISFIEAPLKFSAPNVTLQVGLSIGRLVFRALNAAELLLAIVLAVELFTTHPSGPVVASFAVAVVMLAIQLAAVRPKLNQRSEQVLAGANPDRRSNAHYVYVGLELVKVVALVTLGILLLAG